MYENSVTLLPTKLTLNFELSIILPIYSIRRLLWEARASQQKPIVCLISRHFPAGRPEITAVNIEPIHTPTFHQTSLLSILNPQFQLSLLSKLKPPRVPTFTGVNIKKTHCPNLHCCQYWEHPESQLSLWSILRPPTVPTFIRPYQSHFTGLQLTSSELGHNIFLH